MANLFDYIDWRGDLTLQQDSFNEIDNLILSRLSYVPFDKIINNNEIVSIKELTERFKKLDINKLRILWKGDEKLLPVLGKSKRFGDMKITGYVNKVETDVEKQFSAITIIMPDDTIYISYRGTDDTIVGWKEDFNMSFESHLASQLDSVKYLEEISRLYSNKIRLGGHSKGGNLAIYSAAFSNSNIKDRIINIYSNDAPGFRDEIVETKEYRDILNKVESFIPQSSIIGRLLKHKEKSVIVKSDQKGIMQHDLYSWQVIGNKFITLEEATSESLFVNKTINDWLDDIDDEKRKLVVGVLFDALASTKGQSIYEIKDNWFANTRKIVKSYKKVDNETKEVIMQTLHQLFKIAKNNSSMI